MLRSWFFREPPAVPSMYHSGMHFIGDLSLEPDSFPLDLRCLDPYPISIFDILLLGRLGVYFNQRVRNALTQRWNLTPLRMEIFYVP